MSRAETVLEQQSLLMAALGRPIYHEYVHQVVQSEFVKKSGPIVTMKGRPSGEAFCMNEERRLAMAAPYFVAAEMMGLITQRMGELSGTARTTRDLFPSDYGFVWLEQSWTTEDIWGTPMAVRAFSWGRQAALVEKTGQTVPGWMIVSYSDSEDPEHFPNIVYQESAKGDPGAEDGLLQVGRLQVIKYYIWTDEQRLGPFLVEPPKDYAANARRLAEDEAAEEGKIIDHLGEMAGWETQQTVNPGYFFHAFATLLEETVLVVNDPEEAGRQAAKRARRMNLPPRVSVIALRRKQGLPLWQPEQHLPGRVEWQHSWWVGADTGGFDRWQPYGPRVTPGVPEHRHYSPNLKTMTTYTVDLSQGARRAYACHVPGCESRVERIRIKPFVKGPADKPLRQSQKVYALVQ